MTYESEYFLVSLDDAKEFLGVDDATEDNVIGYLMNVVSKLFDTATGRSLIASDLTEYYEGNGTDTLYLRSYPVNSTNETIEVYIDGNRDFDNGTRVTSASLFIDSEMGKVVYVGGTFHKRYAVKVVYNAGYTTVPYDLQGAALEALGVLWKRKSEGRFDTSTLSRGDVSYTYLADMPHTVTETLKRYRRW